MTEDIYTHFLHEAALEYTDKDSPKEFNETAYRAFIAGLRLGLSPETQQKLHKLLSAAKPALKKDNL